MRNGVFNYSAFNYNLSVKYTAHKHIFIGIMNTICTHCDAFRSKNKAAEMCCAGGKMTMPNSYLTPERLWFQVIGMNQNISRQTFEAINYAPK